MIVLLSPAKTFSNYNEGVLQSLNITFPRFLNESEDIIQCLREYSENELQRLFKINEKKSAEVYKQIQSWKREAHILQEEQRQDFESAVFSYNGEAYKSFDAGSLSPKDIVYAQKYLKILSALYGVLRPLDIITPYRLDMNTRFPIQESKNLYAFWKEQVTSSIVEDAHESKSCYIINLASDEFFSMLDVAKIPQICIHVKFYQMHQKKYKSLSVFNKQARGLLARYIITQKVKDINKLTAFNAEGYVFDKKESTEYQLVFRKG